MKPVYVAGCGLWTPGYPTVAAWRAKASEETGKPAAKIVPSRLRRHLSVLTRMQVECVSQAGETAGFDLSTTPTVFGSALGEIQIAVAQMKMMKIDEGIVSPAYFKNSVHNTAGGAFSIAAKNRGFTTAMAGGDQTLATVLLEAFALINTDETDVVAVVGDEALPEPLDGLLPYESLTVAFALTTTPVDEPLARLRNLAFGGAGEQIELPQAYLRNPSAQGLALLEAVDRKAPCTLSLTPAGAPPWSVEIDFP